MQDKDEARGKQEKLLTRIRDRYKIMEEADHDNREMAMEDMKFVNVPGQQWEDNMKQERGNRPCYEFNKVRPRAKRVINDMRANRPMAKVRPVEDGDKTVAEINEGLIRNIWNCSDGDSVIDAAAEYQVDAGMGAWRVTTDYADERSFNQDIKVEAIQNPFCLYCDPSAKDYMKRDADDWILTEKIPHKQYEARWPKAERSDFEELVQFDDDDAWQDEEMVRIAEYWWKEPYKKELWKLEDGRIVDSESDEANAPEVQAMIAERREVMANKILSCIASGSAILEGPTRWAGRSFPFIMVYGEWMIIDGRQRWWGLPRFAKDAQRSYNVSRTAVTETIAQAPKSFFWATADQARGLTKQWAEMHKKNLPFALFNPDPKNPGAPQRMGGADVPVGLIHELQLADQELKDVMGIYDASMGEQSNEKSGRAIYARQQQGEIATFNYRDNMSKAVQRTYEIILDLIPEIYDTERELRILGADGAEDYVRVNQVVFDPKAGKSVRVNDLRAGRYDVTVTVGPSFSTQRQEAAETYGALVQQYPELMGVAGDLIMKSMDLPYAEDIAERMKALLPTQIQQQMNQDKEIPPEVQQMMMQAEQAMQAVEEQGKLVQAAAGELEQEKAATEKLLADNKTDMANIRAMKAEFDAHVAKEMAKLIQKEAGLTGKEANLTVKGAELKEQAASSAQSMIGGERGSLDMVTRVDAALADFMQGVDEAVGRLNQRAQVAEAQASRQIVNGTVRREGGKLVADAEYSDGSRRSLRAVRENGQLRIVPEADAGPEPAA